MRFWWVGDGGKQLCATLHISPFSHALPNTWPAPHTLGLIAVPMPYPALPETSQAPQGHGLGSIGQVFTTLILALTAPAHMSTSPLWNVHYAVHVPKSWNLDVSPNLHKSSYILLITPKRYKSSGLLSHCSELHDNCCTWCEQKRAHTHTFHRLLKHNWPLFRCTRYKQLRAKIIKIPCIYFYQCPPHSGLGWVEYGTDGKWWIPPQHRIIPQYSNFITTL